MTIRKPTRREFLAATGAAAAGTLITATARAANAPAAVAAAASGKPQRVIFLVSDGMSMGVPSLAEQLSMQARKQQTHWMRLLKDPATACGYFETHSLNSLVTDSAAASSAWGSGSRVANGVINVLPDGTELKPIMRILKEHGFGTGLASTATITHATPAGFAAVEGSRGDEEKIALQYPGVVDVALGGGQKFFDAAKRSDKADATEPYRKAGYGVVRTRDEMLASKDAKLLGIFYGSHLPYTVDQRESAELRALVPTLAEMTRAALDRLHQNPKGFLLQVEGARVDHAAHANDTAGTLWDQIAFDDAIGSALEYQAQNPETLVVITSDHGNANPGLNGIGRSYEKSTQAFEKVAAAKASVSAIEETLNGIKKDAGSVTAANVQQLIQEKWSLEFSDADAALVADSYNGTRVPEINEQHRKFVGILGQVTGNHTGIGWTGTTHTEDLTLITAIGPGQEAYGRLLRNTDFFGIALGAFGIEFRNPSAEAGAGADRQTAAAAAHIESHWA